MANADKPLKVLIVGGGIGGLMAATVLRQHGHDIEIYERSQLLQETSAAVHIAPNAHGLLKRFGLYPLEFGANVVNGVYEWDIEGKIQVELDATKSSNLWQHEWVLCHRVDLHTALLEKATGPDGPNKPAMLKTGAKVTSVDVEAATIKFEDGSTVTGDLIIGADGVSSVTRKAVVGDQVKTVGSGKSAFRFLVPHEEIRKVPEAAYYASQDGVMHMWIGGNKRIIMYPCHHNTMQNFVCLYPSGEYSESAPKGDDWSDKGSKDALLETFKHFPEAPKALLNLVKPDSVKAWTLYDMERIPHWYKGKALLLGDAAHPFLPHQGQGAAIAMEDAVAITTLLPMGTTPEDIPERLALYQKLRDERAHKIQAASRLMGEDIKPDERNTFNMFAYTAFNYGHDEYHNSSAALRKLLATKNGPVYYRQPISFGPSISPRQNPFLPLSASPKSSKATVTTTTVLVNTSATYLKTLFPNAQDWSFANPGSKAQASFVTMQLGNLDWLGGGSYNVFGLFIHGVKYKKAGTDTPPVVASFLPVLFESFADPITTGREELGMPKVYADVAVNTDYAAGTTSTVCSWRGHKFLDITINGLKEFDSATDVPPTGPAIPALYSGGPPTTKPQATLAPAGPNPKLLVYRYVPAVGKPGVADVEYPVLNHDGAKVSPAEIKTAHRSKDVSVKWDAGDWKSLPTLHNIVAGLAEAPIYSIIDAKIEVGEGTAAFDNLTRLE